MLFSWAVLALRAFATSHEASVVLSIGKVVGTSVHGVNKFIGIPFAATPPLRFAPPSAPAKQAIIKANSLKPACIQQFNYPKDARDFVVKTFNDPAGPPQESEDCLYLSVFAPSNSNTLKPVMVWIFGGGLQYGTAFIPFYDGSWIARYQDVLVVTFNYRTNVFGFLNSPEIPYEEQNMGFLDQRFALQWVQENIEAFGGDPKKVTIFGESAGGYSVKQLVANPPSPLPFRAAIMQSEAGPTNPSNPYQELLNLTNCTTATSGLECLRQVPAPILKDTIEKNELIFPPQFNNITAVQSTGDVFTKGRAAKIPLMLGTTADEGSVFSYVLLLITPDATVESFLESAGLPPLQAMTIAKAYQSDTVYESLSAVFRDFMFQCPTSLLASTAADAGYSVWRYFYNATFENLQPFPGAGAFHSSEIPEVFGTYYANSTDDEIGLSKAMQKIWTDFAKNPGCPGWPQVSDGALDLLNSTRPYEYTTAISNIDRKCELWQSIILNGGF